MLELNLGGRSEPYPSLKCLGFSRSQILAASSAFCSCMHALVGLKSVFVAHAKNCRDFSGRSYTIYFDIIDAWIDTRHPIVTTGCTEATERFSKKYYSRLMLFPLVHEVSTLASFLPFLACKPQRRRL
jgi:hypothetical protein